MFRELAFELSHYYEVNSENLEEILSILEKINNNPAFEYKHDEFSKFAEDIEKAIAVSRDVLNKLTLL